MKVSRVQNNKAFAQIVLLVLGVAGLLLLAGCRGISTSGERQAQRDLQSVSQSFRPEDRPLELPVLSTNAPFTNFLAYAMLNQPKVASAYFDWAASVQRITVERSLPDPKLTFQSDIADVLMSVMPGLMQEFPGPGKLKAAANVATAESRARYFTFETAVLQTAFTLKQSYYQLWFLNEKVRINREMLGLLGELEQAARAQNEVGKVTLQDVYRAQIEQDKLQTEIANLEDSRHPMTAQFKGALGLLPNQADPPFPSEFESTPIDLNGDNLLATAFARNPRLRQMEAEVQQAEASIAVARKSKIPDFSLGLMADVKANPVMYRPQASMTLPIWRDKIAAEIAAAQAGKRAAEARLNAEQIGIAVDFAMKSYDYREITRTLALLQEQLIPKAQQSLEIARAGYLAGQIDFFNLIDTEQDLLRYRLAAVEARARREIILADLSLSIAGIAPQGAPLLPAGASDQTAPDSSTH